MADHNPDPHSDLISSLQQSGDPVAFENLYDVYAPVLFGVIVRIVSDEKEAENLLQDCFVKIWKNCRLYNPDKGRVATWLINIARHTAIDFIRTPYFQQKIKVAAVSNIEDSASGMTIHQPDMESSVLKQLVEKLSPDCRVVIERMYFEGYTQQEISDTFGIPLGTVKTRSRTALKELRTYFNFQ